MSQREIHRAAEGLVRSLGVTGVNLSIRQLICALELLHCDEALIDSVTKRLYPKIAECFSPSTPAAVERNLRTGRDAIVKKGDREQLERILGHKLRTSLSVADLLDSMNYYMKCNGLWPD